jgi:CelD/BcsL family acetyltransferase involved in cellulose biosynthesis
VAQLVNAGHTLVGMIHSDRAAQLVGAVGAEPVVADALDAAAVEHAGRSVRPEAMRDTLAASN